MAKLCPACSKANPANASYCYYDGRYLSPEARKGPLQVGALPLPTPFYFPDGQSCANFNQLALACDARWDEARGLLADGAWQSFFGAIGRLDLAAAAEQAAREPDLDVGLSQLLEKFPTDPNTLRRPQLSLPSAEENLGALTPGTDRRFELLITNRGLLVLRGMATTNCDWLSLGDGAGSALKMFQTRGIYSLPVRVLGNRLRAGGKPLQGEIVIDTNGGALKVPVRADVPVRPFPGGTPANDVLAGAKSPRQLAVKAKAHPNEAAVLFEQGAVKNWYASNGWTYPVQGTQASGKAAVQQFFEALGLSKPPRLEIDTESLLCNGTVGRRLTRLVTISTTEPRLVYAQAWSDQQWIKAGPGKSQGNKVTIPLRIEVPPRPGETFHANVTIQGNGHRQFVVPVTLAVSAAPANANAPAEEPAGGLPQGWIFAGLAGLLLVLVVGAVAFVRNHPLSPIPPPSTHPHGGPEERAMHAAWWDEDDIPNTNLAASASALKEIAPEDQTIFDGIASKDEEERGDAYEKLAVELPKLLSNPKLLGDLKAKDPLGQLLVDCCVFDPSALCVRPLGQALTSQLPRDGTEFQPDKKGEELERGLWAMHVLFGALKHPAMTNRLANIRNLTDALADAFGPDLNEKAPTDELEAQTETLLAERYYGNTLPTAKKSFEYALVMRDSLIQTFPHLTPAFRAPVDLELLTEGFSKGDEAWPRLGSVLKSCLDSADPAVVQKVVTLYENADQEAAKRMEASLAAKWPAAGDAKTRAEKAQKIRVILAAEAISPQARLAQVRKLAHNALGLVWADRKKESILLRDTVRLAHASTMACDLFHKDGGVEGLIRFDDLVKQVPDVDQTEEENSTDKKGNSKLVGKGKVVDDKVINDALTAKSAADPTLPGFVCKRHLYALKANQPYTLLLQSVSINTHLRLEDPKGASCKEADDRGIPRFIVRLSFTPTEDDDYQVVVSAPAPGKTAARYDLQVKRGFDFPGRPFFGPSPFGPVMVPAVPQPQPAPKAVDKDKPVNPVDLARLDSKVSTERVAALENLAGSVVDDLTPLQAQKIARYLLVTDQAEDESEKAKPNLEKFRECRPLLLALADLIGDEGIPIAQKRTEAIVGGVLARPLEFAADQEWRPSCRTMLVRRALDLTSGVTTGADQAADILRNLYQEQGRAFGVETPGFFELTGPTEVLEGVIKHVAAKAAHQNPSADAREYLGRLDRQLRVARFLAENDLEYMVLLQRVWVKVLVIYLQEKAPDRAEAMTRIPKDLDDQDRRASGALDQLRMGEEKVLRIWALADDLK